MRVCACVRVFVRVGVGVGVWDKTSVSYTPLREVFQGGEDEAILIKTLLHWLGSSTQAIRRFVCKFSAAQTIVSYWFSWCNVIVGNPSNQMVDFLDGALVKYLFEGERDELFQIFP